MSDGKSLKKSGVTPDELASPAPEDLAAERDPVLAKPVTEAGAPLDPVGAGKLLPYRWEPLLTR